MGCGAVQCPRYWRCTPDSWSVGGHIWLAVCLLGWAVCVLGSAMVGVLRWGWWWAPLYHYGGFLGRGGPPAGCCWRGPGCSVLPSSRLLLSHSLYFRR
ncbi:hypothetical protein GDO81_023135 [Engystomops pustulosus]|uniref:Uncharacterized protein n=1 Tax=Engystomops pustulosus TaxID=76066 RepID=A0AAV6Z9S9_ENGPU|nr:hypothetical protein GDO81_023135 [Engystomops pustulosus]